MRVQRRPAEGKAPLRRDAVESLARKLAHLEQVQDRPAAGDSTFAWRNLSKFAKTLQKGQLITLDGVLRCREVKDQIKGITFKHRIAEIHAISIKRLSKIEADDDPSDGADDESSLARVDELDGLSTFSLATLSE